MLKRNIIFIFPYSPTAWDAKRFGFDFFRTQGIQVKVWDLSQLVPSRADKGHQFLQTDFIHKIKSYSQLEMQIRQESGSATFIDCINGLSGLRFKTRHIFRLFKKYNSRYFIVEIGSLPLKGLVDLQRIINKAKKAMQIKKLFRYLYWKITNLSVDLRARYLGTYQMPAKIFVGHTDLLASYLKRYDMQSNVVVPIHSFDYDRYLAYKEHSSLHLEQLELKKPFCVFLDQALPNHSDFGRSGSSRPITPELYIASMRVFFDQFEKETGLNIVIALSPRALYPDPDVFGKRPMIKDKTLELVAECSFVLAHNSTAINFAVLFDKPILLLKTTEMSKSLGFGNVIDNMSKELGVKIICIDESGAIQTIDLPNYEKWERNFANYKHKYVMTKDIHPKTTWQFVIDELDSLSEAAE